MKLRGCQPRVDKETVRALKGNKNILVVCPTGSGKTVLSSSIMHKLLLAGKRCVFIVHMDQLAVQKYETLCGWLMAWGFPEPSDYIGLITGRTKPDYSKQLQIASIQALAARRTTITDMIFHVAIFDEAHLSSAHKFAQEYFLQGSFPGKCIGYTATPVRTNPRESMLTLGWQFLVAGDTVAEMQDQGLLCRMKYWSRPSARIDSAGVKKRLGDYDQKELSAISSTPDHWHHAWTEWNRLAGPGTPTLGFAVTIQHAQDLADYFVEKSGGKVKAVVVSAKTPHAERKVSYDAIETNEIDIIFSVGVCSIGFNKKNVRCLLIARKTLSEQIHIQMLGRGARIYPEKEFCTVIDLAGNCEELGLLEHQGEWTLEPPSDKGPGEAPVRFCPECGAEVPAQSKACEVCGYVFPAKEKKEKVVDVSQLEQLEVKTKASKAQREFASYCKKARKQSYRPGWAEANFKEKYGRYPHAGWRLNAVYGDRPGTKELADYASYLGLLCRKHSESWDYALRYLVSEFGMELVEKHYAGLTRCWRKSAGIPEEKAA